MLKRRGKKSFKKNNKNKLNKTYLNNEKLRKTIKNLGNIEKINIKRYYFYDKDNKSLKDYIPFDKFKKIGILAFTSVK